MATVESPSRSAQNDSSELAGFGYKQELDRSLGSFSAFAAGFVPILAVPSIRPQGMSVIFGLAARSARRTRAPPFS